MLEEILGCLQLWSNHFQNILQVRVETSKEEAFLEVARIHQKEELNHHRQLAKVHLKKQLWDPILDSLGEWYVAQMMHRTDPEKHVLMHLVAEGAAEVFHRKMLPLVQGKAAETHFRQHSESDGSHSLMGIHLLNTLPPDQQTQILETQEKGWQIFHALVDRVATRISSKAMRNCPAITGIYDFSILSSPLVSSSFA